MHRKILITIATAKSYQERRKILRNTWLKDIQDKSLSLSVEYFFFYGKTDRDILVEETDDLVELDCSDQYEYLPEKHWAAWLYALENKEFDYIFDCDDDTFVDLVKLCRLVEEEAEVGLRGEVISAGYDKRLTISGGAGLLISKKRIEEILEAQLPAHGCDDLMIYDYCREHDLDYCHDRRFSHDKFRFPLESNDFITSHWLNESDMEVIYNVYDKKSLITRSNIFYYSSEGRVYVVKKRNDNNYLMGEVERKGKYNFFIRWKESSMLERIEDKSLIDVLSKVGIEIEKEQFLLENPRVAILCCSYKRYEHLVRQLYWSLMQNYDNSKVFFAVKGLDEYQFNRHLLLEFKPYIDSGKLLLRLFPNKNQLSNMIDPIRGEDMDEFDLFVKIDDDDFYSLSYVSDCVALHQQYPVNCSSAIYDREIYTKTALDLTVIKRGGSNIVGNVSTFSRVVMKEFADCEKNIEKLRALSMKYYNHENTNFGQNEDQVLDMLMKNYGLFERKYDSFKNFHVMINVTTVSMMRSYEDKTYLMDRFKNNNSKIDCSKNSWEYIVRIKHPVWERSYIVFDRKGYILEDPETPHFNVLHFDHELLVVKWLNYGVEAFEKDNSGKFIFLEPSEDFLADLPDHITLNIDNFSFRCDVEGNSLLCDSFIRPAVIKCTNGPLLVCEMDGKEYFFLNTSGNQYANIF